MLNWIPMYLRKLFSERPGKIISAGEWNELFTLITTQGDHNTDAIADVRQHLTEQDLTKKVSSDTIKRVRINADKQLEVSYDGVNFEATGSGGHVIENSLGQVMTPRSRMRFMNTVINDVSGVTVISGIKGDKGDQGIQGIQGVQGIQGERGFIGKAIVPSINEYGVMSFSIQDIASAPSDISVRGPQGPQGIQGPQGAIGGQGVQGIQGIQGIQGVAGSKGDKGDKGDPGIKGDTGAQGSQGAQGVKGNDGIDGRSFVIQDVYHTLGALKLAYPDGNEYAYQVTFDKNIYIWSEAVINWVSLGQLQGPQGPQGIQGIQGEGGQTGAKGDPGERGEQGIQGIQGEQGIQGTQGEQGIQGVAGADGENAYQSAQEGGYAGTEFVFNNALGQIPDHIASNDNPHNVTKLQVSLGNVDNTSDANKPVSTLQQAALNLKANKSTLQTATLTAAGWVGSAAPYTQTITVTGVTTTSNQEVLLSLTATQAEVEAMQGANIQDGGQAANRITLKAWGDKPAINIPIRVIVRGDM